MCSSAVEGSEPSRPQRRRRVVVVVDVVESVRLMQVFEDDVISRWRRFVDEVRQQILPAQGARLVKSLGDGMLLEFEQPTAAMSCAQAMLGRAAAHNQGLSPEARIELRVGAHVADVVVDDLDIYGAGVNIAARVASLAGPGAIVVTSELRDLLVQGLDGEFEDLGDCFLKHLDAPVRAFRVAGSSPRVVPVAAAGSDSLRPTVAVLPLTVDPASPDDLVLADIVVADLITQLSRSGHWNVVSRLSSQALKGRIVMPGEVAAVTGAGFAVAGHWRSRGPRSRLTLELVDTRSSHVLWADAFDTDAAAILTGDDELVESIARQVGSAILGHEVRRASQLALPTLESFAILFRAITLMHHSTRESVLEAQRALEHLIDRHPRRPEPRAWMAKCHVLRVAHSSAADAREESARARDHIRRALDQEPGHALANAIDGLVQMFIDRDLDAAEASYGAALAANPNEPLAWLFQSSIHAHRADGASAMACVERATALSPLDPLDQYFNGFTAWACLAAGEYERAERHALRAMRVDSTHRPTHTTLIQAQWLLGKADAARASASRFMAIAPEFSVSRYLRGFPAGPTAYARLLADAMRDAGLPA